MYSRYPNYRFSGGVKIPNNYSGNAFKPTESEAEEPRGAIEVAETELNDESEPTLAVETPEDSAEAVAASAHPRRPLFGGLKFNVGRIFSGGIGFEELLIIGLILLIAQSDTDDDIILLLALLLFVGG